MSEAGSASPEESVGDASEAPEAEEAPPRLGLAFTDLTVEALEAFGRVDVLMLDFYLPPVTGLEVLRQVNDAARAGRIERPKHILGMSSVMSCNARLVAEGADAGFVKWDVGTWSGWAK